MLVPEVFPLTGVYPADGANVPPYIPLLCPFVAPSEATANVRQRVAQVTAVVPRFDFTLTSVERSARM